MSMIQWFGLPVITFILSDWSPVSIKRLSTNESTFLDSQQVIWASEIFEAITKPRNRRSNHYLYLVFFILYA